MDTHVHTAMTMHSLTSASALDELIQENIKGAMIKFWARDKM
jgi:hypothetical protein